MLSLVVNIPGLLRKSEISALEVEVGSELDRVHHSVGFSACICITRSKS